MIIRPPPPSPADRRRMERVEEEGCSDGGRATLEKLIGPESIDSALDSALDSHAALALSDFRRDETGGEGRASIRGAVGTKAAGGGAVSPTECLRSMADLPDSVRLPAPAPAPALPLPPPPAVALAYPDRSVDGALLLLLLGRLLSQLLLVSLLLMLPLLLF